MVIRGSYYRTGAIGKNFLMIYESGGRASRRVVSGFTLLELIVAIGIVAILTAMLLPMIRRVGARAQMVGCQANLNQLFLACTQYNIDYARYPFGFVFEHQNPANGRPADPEDLSHITWFSALDTYLTEGASLVIQADPRISSYQGVARRNYAQAFKCPSVPSMFNQQIQYAQHGVVMPLMTLELGKTPASRPKLTWPAKLTDVNPDTALIWDTPVFTGFRPESPTTLWGTAHTSTGTAPFCTVIDNEQLCNPAAPELRFRGPDADRFSNSTNPLRRPDGPIAWPSDAFLQSLGFPDGTMNTDYAGNFPSFPGNARFRHDGLGCNVLFADGSIRTLYLDPTTAVSGSYITSDFKRYMLMTKWPGGGIRDSFTIPAN